MNAARAILDESGASSISVRSVAGRAGIGASTLRHYFPTQNDLLEAVFAVTLDGAIGDLRIRDTSVPPRERIAECLDQFLPVKHDSLDEALAQWFEVVSAIASSSASPERRAVWGAFIRQANARVVGWLSVLDDEGVLRPGSPERHARLLLAIIDGLAMSALMPANRPTPAQLHETLNDAIAAVVLDTSQTD